MTLKELRQRLLDRLADGLAPTGFNRRGQSFWREVGPVRQVLHVSFINHVGDFDVTADVAVRHHAVEEALNARAAHLNPRDKRETATVGAELGNLAGVGQHRWTITRPEHVEGAATAIMDWFGRVGRPFLERFSSADETLRVIEDGGAEGRLICPFSERRAEVRDALRAQLGGSAV